MENGMTAEEAWELAKKIMFLDEKEGLDSSCFGRIFPGMSKKKVFRLSPQEVKGRIRRYEEAGETRERIKRAVYDLEKLKQDHYALYINGKQMDKDVEIAVKVLTVLDRLLGRGIKLMYPDGNTMEFDDYFKESEKI